ncbi:MAG: family 10 glycosylhydrolase [Oscillospiraceae bacterium]
MRGLKLIAIAVLLSLVIFVIGGCGLIEKSPLPENAQDILSAQIFEQTATPKLAPENYIRAIWVSYLDLQDIISSDEAAYKQNINEMYENLESIKTTDVFFQVRAFGESLYRSEVFTLTNSLYSSYSVETDYLGYAIEQAHSRGMKIHAWINPYRLGASDSKSTIEFCNSINEKSPGSINEFDGRMWIDPSSKAMNELNINYIGELMQKFSFDGLHFDDYFYPTTDEKFDEYSYSQYKSENGTLPLTEWRRSNVSEFVKAANAKAKESREGTLFGVSPDASIERDMNRHYVDVKSWCSSNEYIDYICPQIYFGYNNQTMPFLTTLTDWSELCTECDLIVGLSFYKTGRPDTYAGTGESEWLENLDIISRQYLDSLEFTNCSGIALFRYNSVFNPTDDAATFAQVELFNLQKVC